MLKQKVYLYLAWIIACIMMLGSLYLSEVRHLEPCTLCWYQRIAIFPLTLLLGTALYKNFLGIFSYAIPFPLFGLFFSGYQIAIQEIPAFTPIKVCSSTTSCYIKGPLVFGFFSIAMLSFICSAWILIFLIASREKKNSSD